MEYPVLLTFRENHSCKATFPDHPGIFVVGSDANSTLDMAGETLIKTLTNLLRCKGPIPGPSQCKLGQQLIAIPEDLAVRITARNADYHVAQRYQGMTAGDE